MTCVLLAEKAEEALSSGDFSHALEYLRAAISAAESGNQLPCGEDGQPDKSWLAYWEGACMVLDAAAAWQQAVFIEDREPHRTLWEFLVYLVRLHRKRWAELIRRGLS